MPIIERSKVATKQNPVDWSEVGWELEVGVEYHKWKSVSGDCWEPEVHAVGQCEDKGEVGWIEKLLVVGVGD